MNKMETKQTPAQKKALKRLTPAHYEALELIKKSFADIWSHPNGARGGRDEMGDVCEYCGKKTSKGGKESMFFSILISGLIVPNSIPENIIWDLSCAGLTDQPQGAFPIGPECAKKLLGKELNNYKF